MKPGQPMKQRPTWDQLRAVQAELDRVTAELAYTQSRRGRYMTQIERDADGTPCRLTIGVRK